MEGSHYEILTVGVASLRREDEGNTLPANEDLVPFLVKDASRGSALMEN